MLIDLVYLFILKDTLIRIVSLITLGFCIQAHTVFYLSFQCFGNVYK